MMQPVRPSATQAQVICIVLMEFPDGVPCLLQVIIQEEVDGCSTR